MECRVCAQNEFALAMELRVSVFVREQGVSPELEQDERDAIATHAICTENGQVVAAGRFYRIEQTDTALLGRICVRKEFRKQGYGRAICTFLLKQAALAGCTQAEIHAQLHAVPFYETLGFTAYGEPFLDAGIPHRSMAKSLAKNA